MLPKENCLPKEPLKKIPQLLKWIGNKHRFAPEIISLMPADIDTYFEPFLGSGAVLGTLSNIKCNSGYSPAHYYKKAVASDVLDPLIEIFNYVKSDPETLINHYTQELENYNENKESKYLEIRDRFNKNRSALDFAILSRTCYSGVIRFRKADGYMSTPVGPHKPISSDSFADRVMMWHNIIQDANFIKSDFRDTMKMAKYGDVVYCDPPYTHSQKIVYGAQAFDINDLFKEISGCKKRGAKVMLSINGKKKSGTEYIGIIAPPGLFERSVEINCGISMINRLQRNGKEMIGEGVHDQLLLTW